MIVSLTGHRPDKLPNKETGYTLPNPTYIYVCQEIEKLFIQLKPEKIISGMALGVDQWAANIAIKLNIPYIAAVPFAGQESKWPIKSQKIYNSLIAKASEIHIVCDGEYSGWKLQKRNEWMVDNSDEVIAVWDGTKGGTANCVDYITIKNKKYHRIDPRKAVTIPNE